jgi:hypothetical protein
MGAMEIRRLRNAAKKNRTARLLFEHLAARDDGATETSVESLVAELRETEVAQKRVAVVKTLQYLESLGCGKFIPGRHSKPSRMSWSFDVRAIARLALEEVVDRPANQHAASEGEGYAVRWAAHRAESGMTASSPWDEILHGRE